MSKSPLQCSDHLLKRFEDDIKAVHYQMSILEVVFSNFKGSWFAINQAHKLYKLETEHED